MDGWRLHRRGEAESAELSITDDGIMLAVGTAAAQYFDMDFFDGRQMTCTALIDQTLYSYTFIWSSSASYVAIKALDNGFRFAYSGTNNYMQLYNVSGSDRSVVEHIKLEYGDHFTGWTETDPGEELVRCRRQYVRWGPYEKAGLAFGSSTTTAAGYIPIPQMRATPVLRFSNLTLGNSRDVTGMTLSISGPNMIELAIASNVTSGLTYNIRVAAGGYLELDARL